MARTLRILGTLVALTCIVVLLVRQAGDMPVLDLRAPGLWFALAVALLCYVGSQLAAAEAWRSILRLMRHDLPLGLAWGQPLVSQIGKYIPGNVAHLLGRVALGHSDGVAARATGAGMLLEVGLTLGAGLALAGLLVLVQPQFLASLLSAYPQALTYVVTVATTLLVILGLGIGATILRSRLRSMGTEHPALQHLVRPALLLAGSLLILGVSLWATANAVAPTVAPDLVTCTLVFAGAWVVGFAMPGAPGGIGVRDSIIVLGLAASMGEGTALSVALLHRGVSIAGDLVSFAIGWQMRRRHLPPNPNTGPNSASLSTD